MIGNIIPLLVFFWYCYTSHGQNQMFQHGHEACIADSVCCKTLPGAEQLHLYTPVLKGKNLALVVNHTSVVGNTHLVDTLLKLGASIKAIFAPEHGFRGNAADGELIDDSTDAKTGIRVISLYGSIKKPRDSQLKEIDMVIYDIQDVGVRFYTYISTMHYIMEACALNGKKLLILDRPNPNDHYIDGPVLDTAFRSFVGMHPIPVVYAMTPGELARMIAGEHWIQNSSKLLMDIIPVANYHHGQKISLPIAPSPNLPNMQSINLYPSLCFFEATPVSIGRGTPYPFQVVGYPDTSFGRFHFTPQPIPHVSTNPPQKGVQCYGRDLRNFPSLSRIDLSFLLDFFKKFNDKKSFFERAQFFDKLAGGDEFRKMIQNGSTEEEIRASWKPKLDSFRASRSKYLLYKDKSELIP